MEKRAKSVRALARKNLKTKTDKKSGDLYRSIQMRKVDDLSYDVGVFDKDVFYASFIELGTKKMPRRPFLRPAFKQRRRAISNGVRRSIQKGMKEIAS